MTSVRLLDRDELQAHVRSERYLGGLLDPRSGHLQPLKYTQGLARAAETAGARIFENSEVLRYEDGREVRAHTAARRRCAAGTWCSAATPTSAPVAPALVAAHSRRGHLHHRHRAFGRGARSQALLPSNAAVADINWILDYFRRSRRSPAAVRRARELQLGAAAAPRGIHAPAHGAGFSRTLADSKVAYAWGGYLDITMSRAPDFGRLAPNVYYLQGFSGHGMALAGLAGQLAAEAIAGTAERFDVFARIPHRDFPGGRLLRRPSLMLAMLYYRLRDVL